MSITQNFPDNDPIWTAEEITRTIHGTCLHDQAWQVTGVSIDCRSLAPGDLFIAMRGALHDGHDYVAEAFEAGAVAAIVMRQPSYVPSHVPLIYVDDTLAALEQLGLLARQRTEARIIAFVGAGKTASKTMLGSMLSACGKSYAAAQSLDNDCLVPLSLARLPRDAYNAMFELNMGSPGELTMLSHRIKPHIALITPVSPHHREFYDQQETIIDMQSEIFSGLAPQGIALLNRDEPLFGRLFAAAKANGVKKILTYGTAARCDARLTSSVACANGIDVTTVMLGQRFQYHIVNPDAHADLNSVGTLLAALLAGGDAAACTAALGARDELYQLAI